MATHTREPSQFAAGETLEFSRSLSDYPASQGWIITYSLRAGTGSKIDFDSEADGNTHSISVDAETTANWLPGRYQGVGVVELEGVKHQVWAGWINITPNLASQEGDYDPRSQAQKDLEVAILTRSKLLALTVVDSSVEGTSLRRRELEDLNKTIDRLTLIVRAEEAQASGRSTRRNIRIRFT